MILSIIIPLYNEQKTILELLYKIESLKNINKEIIIIDDCSTDNSLDRLKNYQKKSNIKIIEHEKNLGKGAAIISGKKYVTGDVVIIQDADLEYDPNDYSKLIEPIINEKFKVVYGSRVLNKKRYSSNHFTSFLRIFFNHILTLLSNLLNNQKLTDAHTCYKAFDAKLFNEITLIENKFGFCPEITTKVANLGYEIKEVPISYMGRKYSEGKKIKMIDGLDAIKCLIKYKFFSKK
tara:strand:+ start:1139 stop:1843 length:705 start_codon:yes stop_codon:yes gene_type:complete